MQWSTAHLLDLIALIFAVLSVPPWPWPANGPLIALAAILLAVAGLIS